MSAGAPQSVFQFLRPSSPFEWLALGWLIGLATAAAYLTVVGQ